MSTWNTRWKNVCNFIYDHDYKEIHVWTAEFMLACEHISSNSIYTQRENCLPFSGATNVGITSWAPEYEVQ